MAAAAAMGPLPRSLRAFAPGRPLLLLVVKLLLLLLLVSASPATAGRKPVSEAVIARAIVKANKNAQVCQNQQGCLGKPVTLVLKHDVILSGALPPLGHNAYLIIRGKCKNKKLGNRCIVDGRNNFSIFTFAEFGPPPGKLELSNLVFQRASGGVLTGSLWAQTSSSRVIFRDNTGGVVISNGGMGGYPLQSFQDCQFVRNQGTAILMGSGKYGLANNGTALSVRRSLFQSNVGQPEYLTSGGAVYLAGYGMATFEQVLFVNNTAYDSGGAVHGDQTSAVSFRNTTFRKNRALGGGGGAASGASGFFLPFAMSFCSCSFDGNTASKNPKADQLFFQALNGAGGMPQNVTVSFCDTPIPKGSVFPGPPAGLVNQGNGSACFQEYC